MRTLCDHEGLPIRVTDERLAHIRDRPEMATMESAIAETPGHPERVVQSVVLGVRRLRVGTGEGGAVGREVWWLAETQGEVRPNTALKSEAARLWCEKVSTTKHGRWCYLFVPQRKLEAARATGIQSLADLAAALVRARPKPQLRLFSLDGERIARAAFKTLLPLFTHSRRRPGTSGTPRGW